MLELAKPVEEGTVKNWEDMELLWDYSFKKVMQFDDHWIKSKKWYNKEFIKFNSLRMS